MNARFRLQIAISAVILLLPAVASAFPDVSNTRYADAYDYLSQRGIVEGYADGTGRPSTTLNRAEALKVILSLNSQTAQRVQWFTNHMPRMPLFIDVDDAQWYGPYVEAGFDQGLVTGYPDRTFRPASSVTTEEAIAMLFRAYGLHVDGGGTDGWFAQDVNTALSKNLIAPSEKIYLGDAITRGQFFDIIYRLETTRDRQIAVFPDSPHSMLTRRPQMVADVPGAPDGSNFTITVPALGINNLLVTHPSDSTTSKGLLAPLQKGVGHLFAYPGSNGKIMIYGHSSGYSWDTSKYTKIFTKVHELKAGDRVYVTYKGTQYVYEVTYQQVVSTTDMSPYTGQGEELILYTCWPVGTAKSRLIIHATPVEQVALR